MKRPTPDTIALKKTNLIEAGAGTGKTHTITTLFLRLIISGFNLDKILVVTFTEAATADLRKRIRQRLREVLFALNSQKMKDTIFDTIPGLSHMPEALLRGRLLAALSAFDEAAIFTIHGFCHRVLQENAFESGILFDFELVTEQQPLFEEIVSDFWALEVYTASKLIIDFLHKKKIKLQDLVSLVKKVASQPDRIIVPKKMMPLKSDSNFIDIYKTTRDLWENSHNEIEELLKTHKGVNRRSYNKKNLAKWLVNTASYLEFQEPKSFPKDDGIDKFRSSRLREMNLKMNSGHDYPRHPFFSACEDLCSFPDQWLVAFKQRLMEYFLKELNLRKEDLGVQFFDDLIQQLDKALKGPGGDILAKKILSRYHCALIDEFQDTDQGQYSIFKNIYQRFQAPFFIIGDPKQSIYAFRGADIFTYFKAANDAGDRAYSLSVNWRSDPTLIKGVNRLFSRVSHPFYYDQISFKPVKAREGARDTFFVDQNPASGLKILFLKRQNIAAQHRGLINKGWALEQLPHMISADISRLLASDGVIASRHQESLHPGDIAVLVRTNRQARKMQIALRQLSIPSVLTSGESVFQSQEAIDLLRVLQAVSEPSKNELIKIALATDIFGLSGNDIWDLNENEIAWGDWTANFKRWNNLWQSRGFICGY